MSDYPLLGKPSQLLLKYLLDRPLAWAPRQLIVYRDLKEISYAEFYGRVQRLASLLVSSGVQAGDRVGVLDWDSHRYLELFFAVPMIGAVLHTVNVRLSPEQLHYTLDHAEDTTLLVHTDFLPVIQSLAPRLPRVSRWILLADDGRRPDESLPWAGEYEALLAAQPPGFEFPEFDENTVATLMYTTGTTGDPKGVFFSHRQLVLHTLAVGLAVMGAEEPFRLAMGDVYMPLTPMFHVHAWGVPYLATLLGVKQVYAGRYEPATLLQLFVKHRVTFSHCVPTILQSFLHNPAAAQIDFNGWKLMIGGAALAPGLARQALERGIRIMGGYGMTESCPVVAASHLRPEVLPADQQTEVEVVTRTGFPIPLVRAGVMDEENKLLPPGREHVGELVLQAPWLTAGYFKDEERSRQLWRGGWLHTGDVAFLDPEGYIRITDRLKDVIKIGGEWISSLELESALSQHPAVKEVAVVGVPDAKWDERPHAEVVLRPELQGKVQRKELLQHLHGFIDRGAIHKRAILTAIRIVESIPRTSVGKLDKRALRERLRSSLPATRE